MTVRESLLISLLALFPAYLVGCDKACDRVVTSVAEIDNLTGRELNLEICNLSASKVHSISLAHDQEGAFTLESHNQRWVYTGGPPNACEGIQQNTGIFLTSESFSQVKFCHDPSSSAQIQIVEVYQNCPEGLVAQLSPMDSCPPIQKP